MGRMSKKINEHFIYNVHLLSCRRERDAFLFYVFGNIFLSGMKNSFFAESIAFLPAGEPSPPSPQTKEGKGRRGKV